MQSNVVDSNGNIIATNIPSDYLNSLNMVEMKRPKPAVYYTFNKFNGDWDFDLNLCVIFYQDFMNKIINNFIELYVNTSAFKTSIYAKKIDEATLVLQGNENPNDLPLLFNEASLKQISLVDLANSVLANANNLSNLKNKVELLRIEYKTNISKSIDDKEMNIHINDLQTKLKRLK
jgi:hypothetical protein